MPNVLVVDDDPVFLSLLTEGLEKFAKSFAVMKAADGAEAMELLGKESISLLITDIMMPNVDGLTLLAYVNEHHPSIPCFVMTASENPAAIKKNLGKDILRFFCKPISAEKLGPEIIKTLQEGTPRGAVHGISVISFLQMIELEQKTCLFEVHLPGREKGLFFFEDGILFDVVCGELRGEEAALTMLTHERATFKFKRLPRKKIAKRLDTSIKELVEKKSEPAEEDLPDLVPFEEIAQKPGETTAPEKPKPAKNSIFDKELGLTGRYISTRHGKGPITILRLSRSGLLFRQRTLQLFDEGDKLEVEFELDDNQNTLIRKTVRVTASTRFQVSAEFTSTTHYDALGPYLLYKNLDRMVAFDPSD